MAQYAYTRAGTLWIERELSPERILTSMDHASIQPTMDRYDDLFETRDDQAAMMSGI